ncbi:hypothetical protein J7K19_12800, partial [bacterium]|nr:hypothetical protein [bacterium]
IYSALRNLKVAATTINLRCKLSILQKSIVSFSISISFQIIKYHFANLMSRIYLLIVENPDCRAKRVSGCFSELFVFKNLHTHCLHKKPENNRQDVRLFQQSHLGGLSKSWGA